MKPKTPATRIMQHARKTKVQDFIDLAVERVDRVDDEIVAGDIPEAIKLAREFGFIETAERLQKELTEAK